jgi:two-component system phosphate regulon sensor histidine kinase PhoR
MIRTSWFKYPTPGQVVWFTVIANSFILVLVLVLVKVFLVKDFPVFLVLLIPVAVTLPVWYILSLALERFIYRRIKLIYKTISSMKGAGKQIPNRESLNADIIGDVEQEVQDWTAVKSKEIEELKKLGEFRREFLGNVSHELKTPVFNIQGYIESLIEGELQDENVNMKYLKRAGSNVDRLVKILQDLEMISLLESNVFKLDMRRLNIYDLLIEIIDDLKVMAEKAGITLGLKEGILPETFVIADREKIREVLINLITNSLKYGKIGGETFIGFYDMDKNILIEISDNGIGIEKNHLPRLFERFYVVDKARSRERGGTGLGLSIVKHIVEAHNQNINVRSTPGVGSTFGFTLRKA